MRAPVQARAVFRTAQWLARVVAVGDIGYLVPEVGQRYWPVPPQGIFFVVDRATSTLYLTAVKDARQRREPW
jgi:hypothetical protein